MFNRLRQLLIISFGGALSLPGSAFAYDGSANDTISQIDVSDDTNLGLRVYFANSTACGNTNNWAYVLSTDPNFQIYAAVLAEAKVMGSTVTVFSTRDSRGYCHLGYVQLH